METNPYIARYRIEVRAEGKEGSTTIMLTLSSTLSLNNGSRMPRLGLGVWQIPDGEPAYRAVQWALDAGYRHIDTARIYRNERSVGAAIHDHSVSRNDVWITTKLFPIDALHVDHAFNESRVRLGVDVVDLYLVHFPPPGLVVPTWKRMERLYHEGKVRAIGVSNHSISNLEKIRKACSILPQVNQIHLSPYHCNWELVSYCQDHGIAVEAYSPLTRGRHLADERLVAIAKAYHVSPAQILIRWALQHDFVVIPKSSQESHIRSNADVFGFTLEDEVMHELDAYGSTRRTL
ncbi:MAG: aldo/keto reductase [Candidatus Dormibacteria bacterium]